MIIVPVAGDKVKTADAIPSKVLTYNNLNIDGPCVEVESAKGSSETVFFTDIAEINGRPVRLIKNADGFNVFEVDGAFDRKYQLPQPGESIRAKGTSASAEYEIVRIKLHVRDRLSDGLIFEAFQPGSEELIEDVLLSDIEDVDGGLFNQRKFVEFYTDYSGVEV